MPWDELGGPGNEDQDVIVAIDGPAGAGKSTVARAVAERLGFAHLDTGAMYRALTVAALSGLLDPADSDQLAEVVASLDISLADGTVWLGGRDISAELRAPEVTRAVSGIAAQPAVRAALVPLQRRLADRTDVVVEGRDIGTVVFPDADVKVYLTAAPTERARRRVRQLGLDDDALTIADIESQMTARDQADTSRATAPLQQPADAHRVDSTALSFPEVVDAVVAAATRDRP
jgi:cytidylate kinase